MVACVCSDLVLNSVSTGFGEYVEERGSLIFKCKTFSKTGGFHVLAEYSAAVMRAMIDHVDIKLPRFK